jgi:short-subunit dehydrogenase
VKRILLIGATSAIAQATARLFAANGDALFLVARDKNRVAAVADDLRVWGASSVYTAALDVRDYDRHLPIIDEAIAALGGLDLALLAHGTLPDQKACQESADLARKELDVNALSTISLLTHLASYFEQKRSGTIAVISSVAGDRGRQSNYIYGGAKGAVNIVLQGLRNRLCQAGVHVLTVKPGFVATPMTAAFRKGALWAKPEEVAVQIVQAINDKKDVAYVPRFWRLIMLAIKMIPERIFKRLHL